MQEARRHGAFVCVHLTNTTVRAFAVQDSSCEDHPTCKKVQDCVRGMRPNVEVSTRRGREVKVLIPEKMATPCQWLASVRAQRRRTRVVGSNNAHCVEKRDPPPVILVPESIATQAVYQRSIIVH